MTNRVTVEIICDGPDCQFTPFSWIDNTCHLKESVVRARQIGWQVLKHKALCPKCNISYFLQGNGKTGAVNVVPR